MRSFSIILGLIACSIIIFNWVNALGEIEVGFQATTNDHWIGDSPEAAAERRSQVNTTYGLWLAVVVGVTGGLFYIANEKDKKAKELKTWYETEGKKENQISVNGENVHENIKKRVVELKEENPEWSLNKLVKQLNEEGYIGIDNNLVKEILDQHYDFEKAEKERLKEKVFKIREEHPEWSFSQLLEYLNKEEYFCIDERFLKTIINQSSAHSGLDKEDNKQGKNEIKREIINLRTKLKELEDMVEKEEKRKDPAKKEIIECPYCLEDIYAGAIKCKHCKTDLTSNG